jgi:thiol:disulfide interchange protein
MTPATPNTPNKTFNLAIALVAIALAVVLFLGQRLQAGGTSLARQASAALPIDVALANGKPTLMEFYADWCTSCQAMAPRLAQLKQEYGQRVNFSMLNVDNTKWLPEIEKYRVDGIPHFVFFNSQGAAQSQAIGEQPDPVLRSTLEDLLQGQAPKTIAAGQTSQRQAPDISPDTNGGASDPRSHGAQARPAS